MVSSKIAYGTQKEHSLFVTIFPWFGEREEE